MKSRTFVATALALVALLVYAVETGEWPINKLPRWIGGYLAASERQSAAEATGGQQLAESEEWLRTDSATPYRWCYRAENLAESGKREKALQAMQRAVQLGANLPPVLMRAANLQFREGEIEEALTNTSQILNLVSEYDEIIFSYYRRMDIPVAIVVESGLPKRERAFRAYQRNLFQWADPSDVEAVWSAISAMAFADDAVAGRYVEYLLERRLYDKASDVWKSHLGARERGYGQTNYLFNGGFETEPTGAPFDWRIQDSTGVLASRNHEAREGKFALRLEFAGEENVVYRHVGQVAYLPQGKYRFRVYARSEGVSTDKGLYFRIVDRDSPRRLDVRTGEVRGTQEWQPLEVEFGVRGGGGLVDVRLCRDESLRIDNRIRGRVWIDSVALEATGPIFK